MNDCTKCIWSRRDGGCNSWDCTFIDQTEAANAYTDRLARRMKESPVMVLRQPERKAGRWLEKTVIHEVESSTPIEQWQSAKCSACGKYHTTPYLYYFEHYAYCPHCGAKMEGES